MTGSRTDGPVGDGSEYRRPWTGGELTWKGGSDAKPSPSLAEVVGATGGLPENAVLWIAAGLAGALSVLHQAGRGHGDLQPGNVLLTRNGPRLAGDAPEGVGKPPMPAADMVALGMLLVAAYTGVSGRRPDLDSLPMRLRSVVAVCLAEAPEKRATPAQLLAIIGSLEPDEPVWTVEVDDLITAADRPADSAPPSGRLVKDPLRHKARGLSGARLLLVIVATVLASVAGTALLLLAPGRDDGIRTADAPVPSQPIRLQSTVTGMPKQPATSEPEPSKKQTPSSDPVTVPATPTSRHPSTPTPERTRQTGTVNDCYGKPLSEPVSLLLACGDGTVMLHDLVWTGWGSATSSADGLISEVICQPSCAAGREIASAATVVVSQRVGGRYTLMRVMAPRSPSYTDAYYTLGRLGPTLRS